MQANHAVLARVGVDEGTGNVFEATDVLGLLEMTEATVVLILGNFLDKTADLLACVTAGLQRVTNEVDGGAELVQLDVGLIVPAKPELPGEHLLLDVLQKQTRDEVSTVGRRVQHEQRVLGSSLNVLVASGNLQDVVPQLGVLGRGLFNSTRNDLGAVHLSPAVGATEESHEHVLPHLDLRVDLSVIVATNNKRVGGRNLRLEDARGVAVVTTRLSLMARLNLLRDWVAGATVMRAGSKVGGNVRGRAVCSHGREAVGRHSPAPGGHWSHSAHRHGMTEVGVGVGGRTAVHVTKVWLQTRSTRRQVEVPQVVEQELLILDVEGGHVLWLRHGRTEVAVDGRGSRVELDRGRGAIIVGPAGSSGCLAGGFWAVDELVLHLLQTEKGQHGSYKSSNKVGRLPQSDPAVP